MCCTVRFRSERACLGMLASHRQPFDVVACLQFAPDSRRNNDALIGCDFDLLVLHDLLPFADAAKYDCQRAVQDCDVFRPTLLATAPISPHCPEIPFLDLEIVAMTQISRLDEGSHHPARAGIGDAVPDVAGIHEHEAFIANDPISVRQQREPFIAL